MSTSKGLLVVVCLALTIPGSGCCVLPCPALHKAIEAHDQVSVERLLAKGSNPNNYTCECGYPLPLAAGECQNHTVERLLDAGAKTADVPAELALRDAVQYCDDGLVALLLSHGVSPNANYYLGGTVLMQAVERGDLSIVGLLLDSGADPNQLGRYKDAVQPVRGEGSALMLSAKVGRADLARVLLEHGADPSRTDEYGYTAERVAEEHGHTEVLDIIRSKKTGDHAP